MKKIFYLFLFLVLHCSLIIDNCKCQWVQTNGPIGALANCIAYTDNKIYAGTPFGAYSSFNNGNSWSKISNLSNNNVRYFAYSGSNIFAATFNGIYRSTDNGNSWVTVNNGLTNLAVRVLSFLGNYLFAGTGGTSGTVSLSTDYGTSWSNVLNGVDVTALCSTGSNIYAGTVNGDVYLSTNNGTNWRFAGFGLWNLYIYALTSLGNNVYCGTDLGVYVTSNYGYNWTAVNNGITNLSIRSLLTAGTNIFAGTIHGIFLSTNNGSNWATVNSGLISIYARALAASASNIFTGTNCGFFISGNNGNSWSEINNGIEEVNIASITSLGTNIFAGGASGIFRSENGGDLWTRAGLNSFNVWGPLASLNGNVFAFTSAGLWRTTDNGENWNLSGLPNQTIHCMTTLDNNIFAGTHDDGVFISTDYGENWANINNGLAGHDITTLESNNGILYAGTYGFGAFRSANNGNDWWYIGLTDKHLMGFAFPGPNTIIAGCCDSLFRSTNNGIIWNNVSSGVSLFCENTILMTYGTNVFVSNCGKIFSSTNSGNNWILKDQGLEDNTILTYHISGNYIFAGTYATSVWRRTLSELTRKEQISENVPSLYSLHQNYPNPFNPVTKIKFEIAQHTPYPLSRGENVTLKIYDILGKQITTLVNEQLQPGTYEVTFDGSNLPSGIYFYKLTAGNYIETKKMVLLK